MKIDERKCALQLDNFNYEHFLREARMEESNSLAWLDNYKPNDDYEFPPEERPDQDSEVFNTGSADDFELDSFIKDTLLKRKSDRINKLRNQWTKKELYQLLELGLGLRGDNRWLIKEPDRQVKFRTYPSGGSMYPVQVYVTINKVVGLEPAFYKFYANTHGLVKVSKKITMEDYEQLFPMSKYKLDLDNSDAQNSAFSIFFVTNFQYSFPKYGNLAYRLGLIESGHMAQNLLLVSTGMNKKALPVCGLFADIVAQYAKLKKDDFVQYGIIFG